MSMSVTAYETFLRLFEGLPTVPKKTLADELRLFSALSEEDRAILDSGQHLAPKAIARLSDATGLSGDVCRSYVQGFLWWDKERRQTP